MSSFLESLKRLLREPSPFPMPSFSRSCKDAPCYFYESKEGFYGKCKAMNIDLTTNLASTCPFFITKEQKETFPIKEDIGDMKGTIGELKAIKVIQVIEKKGDAIALNQTDDLAEVIDSANSKGTFGYTTIGGTEGGDVDTIMGSYFTSPAGTNYAMKISVAVRSGTAHSTYMKAAIYRRSDLALIAVTAEASIAVPTTADWRHLYFSSPVLLAASTEYFLVLWVKNGGYIVYLRYAAGTTNQGLTKFLTYDSFPNPLTGMTYNNNQYSIYCTYYTGDYQTVKTINISTPSIPSGLIVYKYAILVSLRICNSVGTDRTWCKVYVDDILLAEMAVITSSPTVFDRAKDVDAGSHHVDIAIWGGGTGKCDNARAVCGVGTVEQALTKVIEVQVSGDSKALVKVAGQSWAYAPTVTAEVRTDESTVDKVTVTQAVTQGGSVYENYASIMSYVYNTYGYYEKTNTSNTASFLTYSQVKNIKMMLL